MALFLHAIIKSSAFMLMAVITAFLTFFLGPDIETRFFPVLTDIKVIPVPSDVTQPNSLRVLLHAMKKREVCDLVDRLVTVRVTGEEWTRGTVFFKDKTTNEFMQLGKTRTVGDMVVDEVLVHPKGQGLHMVAIYRCHPFWLTTASEVYVHTLPVQPPQRLTP